MRCAVMALTVLVAGCAATAPTPSPLVLTSNATQYSIEAPGDSAIVAVVVENRSNETLYTGRLLPPGPGGPYPLSCGLEIQGYDGIGYASVSQTACQDTASIPFAPNGQVTIYFSLRPGMYRVAVSYSTESGHIATKQAASNPFTVNP